MLNAAITILPVVLTFAVAAWHKPTDEVQPRSALSNDPIDSPCSC
jgi:hypothetical protein